MAAERNTADAPSLVVKELGLTEDGASDEAIATITGSYPHEPNTYSRNNECDMEVSPESGSGELWVFTNQKRRLFKIDADTATRPVVVEKGERYFYSAEAGGKLVVRLVCTPPWNPDQYEIVHYDVN